VPHEEGEREREEKKMGLPPVEENRIEAAGRKETEEKGKWSSPKDLCVKSENCRDLFVKQNFPLI
jgi:hypothetical protein